MGRPLAHAATSTHWRGSLQKKIWSRNEGVEGVAPQPRHREGPELTVEGVAAFLGQGLRVQG